jgi:hypothetical protein
LTGFAAISDTHVLALETAALLEEAAQANSPDKSK